MPEQHGDHVPQGGPPTRRPSQGSAQPAGMGPGWSHGVVGCTWARGSSWEIREQIKASEPGRGEGRRQPECKEGQFSNLHIWGEQEREGPSKGAGQENFFWRGGSWSLQSRLCAQILPPLWVSLSCSCLIWLLSRLGHSCLLHPRACDSLCFSLGTARLLSLSLFFF